MTERILHNRAQCRVCGDVIESTFRHDFVSCECGAIAVDGGKDYLKRSGNPADVIELSECMSDEDLLAEAYNEYEKLRKKAIDFDYKKGWVFYRLKDKYGADIALEVCPKGEGE